MRRVGFFSLNSQTGKLSPKFVADVRDYPSDMLGFLAYSVFIISNPPPLKKNTTKKCIFKMVNSWNSSVRENSRFASSFRYIRMLLILYSISYL